MAKTFNVYCDESCHLENDRHPVMVIGAVWCPEEKVRSTALDIKNIKKQHHLPRTFEVKWTKVSSSKYSFYEELIHYFFSKPYLHFRALIVSDKSRLNHTAFPGQDHELFYYKMFFQMLHPILNPSDKYRIYIDIKDTRGIGKQRKLHEVLCNKQKDFQREVVERVQQIRSHESELLQLADLLIGAICYANRRLRNNPGKTALVDRIRERTGYTLTHSTFLREEKFNLFCWNARELGE